MGKSHSLEDIKEALRIYKKALGDENPSTIDVANVLATLTDE